MQKGIALLALLVGVCGLQACSGEAPDSGPATAPRPAGKAENPWPFLGETQGTTALTAGELLQSNYYVIADGSGSMGGNGCAGGRRKIDVSKLALQRFAPQVPADANLGLAVFDMHGIHEDVPLGTGNRDAFIQRVNSIQPSDGTPLRSAIKLGYDRLTAQARRQLGYGEYHLVVVTDGEASPGEEPLDVVNGMFAESPVVLHTIGFCIDEDHSLNQPGRTVYAAAGDFDSLSAGLSAVLAEAPGFTAARFK